MKNSRPSLLYLEPSIVVCTVLMLMSGAATNAETISVRYISGCSHGYVVLRDLQGSILASGEETTETLRGGRLSSRLTFRFRDGSLDEETTTYTERPRFHLLSDHHTQRGPSFPHPLEMTLDASSGMVTVKSEDHGKETVTTEHMNLPDDLSNGLLTDIIKNIRPETAEMRTSMVVGGSKARVIKLAISPDGEEPFTVGGLAHISRRYTVKVELGGVAGVVAPVIGKAPKDIHVWMTKSGPPTLLRAEGQFYLDGPVWRVETAGATWKK